MNLLKFKIAKTISEKYYNNMIENLSKSFYNSQEYIYFENIFYGIELDKDGVVNDLNKNLCNKIINDFDQKKFDLYLNNKSNFETISSLNHLLTKELINNKKYNIINDILLNDKFSNYKFGNICLKNILKNEIFPNIYHVNQFDSEKIIMDQKNIDLINNISKAGNDIKINKLYLLNALNQIHDYVSSEIYKIENFESKMLKDSEIIEMYKKEIKDFFNNTSIDFKENINDVLKSNNKSLLKIAYLESFELSKYEKFLKVKESEDQNSIIEFYNMNNKIDFTEKNKYFKIKNLEINVTNYSKDQIDLLKNILDEIINEFDIEYKNKKLNEFNNTFKINLTIEDLTYGYNIDEKIQYKNLSKEEFENLFNENLEKELNDLNEKLNGFDRD